MGRHSAEHIHKTGRQERVAGAIPRTGLIRRLFKGNAQKQVPQEVQDPAALELGRDIATQVETARRREVQARARAGQATRVDLKLGKPENIHGQYVDVREDVGPSDGHGNNRVATFELPGNDDKGVEFTVIVRADGRSPIMAAAGRPQSWVSDIERDEPSVTVLPTADLPLLEVMNRPGLSEKTYEELVQGLRYVTTTPGQPMKIGNRTFPDLLGPEASGEHLSIAISDRTPPAEGEYAARNAIVTITDISLNGTDNVRKLSAI